MQLLHDARSERRDAGNVKEAVMNLIRYEPAAYPTFPFLRGMDEMSDRLNRFFGTWTRPTEKELLTVADWTPVVDIQETDLEYLVKAELPEVKKEDVKVTVENGVLTLQGERKQ
jgi:HSP20 family protein